MLLRILKFQFFYNCNRKFIPFSRAEASLNNSAITEFESFNFKSKVLNNTSATGNVNVKIAVQYTYIYTYQFI